MIEKQLVPVDFSGLNTKPDPKRGPTGSLLIADNVLMERTQEWAKRKGWPEQGRKLVEGAKEVFSWLNFLTGAALHLLASKKQITSISRDQLDIFAGKFTELQGGDVTVPIGKYFSLDVGSTSDDYIDPYWPVYNTYESLWDNAVSTAIRNFHWGRSNDQMSVGFFIAASPTVAGSSDKVGVKAMFAKIKNRLTGEVVWTSKGTVDSLVVNTPQLIQCTSGSNKRSFLLYAQWNIAGGGIPSGNLKVFPTDAAEDDAGSWGAPSVTTLLPALTIYATSSAGQYLVENNWDVACDPSESFFILCYRSSATQLTFSKYNYDLTVAFSTTFSITELTSSTALKDLSLSYNSDIDKIDVLYRTGTVTGTSSQGTLYIRCFALGASSFTQFSTAGTSIATANGTSEGIYFPYALTSSAFSSTEDHATFMFYNFRNATGTARFNVLTYIRYISWNTSGTPNVDFDRQFTKTLNMSHRPYFVPGTSKNIIAVPHHYPADTEACSGIIMMPANPGFQAKVAQLDIDLLSFIGSGNQYSNLQRTGDQDLPLNFTYDERALPLTHSTSDRVYLSETVSVDFNISAAGSTQLYGVWDYQIVNHKPSCFSYDTMTVVPSAASAFITNYESVSQQFLMPPDTGQLASTNSAGALTGTYLTCFTYVYKDSNGNLHESEPSDTVGPFSLTSQVQNYTIPVYPWDNKINLMALNLYRTTNGGSILYLDTSSIISSSTDTTVAISTTLSDAVLETSKILYTEGDVLPNKALPSHRYSDFTKNRLVLWGTDNNSKAYFTKEYVQGEAFAYTNGFDINFNNDDDIPSGLKVMDDKIIFFKKKSISYVVGDFPNDQGLGSSLSTPQSIATDVGCEDDHSLVSTQLGIFFRSKKGFCLLDRGLNVNFLPEPDYYAGETVLRAAIDARKQFVYFLLSNSTILVWDYFHQKWTRLTSGVTSIQDITVWENTLYVMATSSGTSRLLKETAGTFQDVSGTDYQTRVMSSWIDLTGVASFKRLYALHLVGEYRASHTIRVKVGYDYETDWTDIFLLTPTGITAVTNDSYYDPAVATNVNDYLYELECKVSRQKCTSFRVLIESVNATNEAFRFSGINMEVGIKKGLNKLPTTKAMVKQ